MAHGRGIAHDDSALLKSFYVETYPPLDKFYRKHYFSTITLSDFVECCRTRRYQKNYVRPRLKSLLRPTHGELIFLQKIPVLCVMCAYGRVGAEKINFFIFYFLFLKFIFYFFKTKLF